MSFMTRCYFLPGRLQDLRYTPIAGFLFLLLMFPTDVLSQTIQIQRVSPAHWFTGFQRQSLQLLLYGPGIKGTKVRTTYPGVTVDRVQYTDNPNYIFADLTISPAAKPGIVTFQLSRIFPLTEKRANGSTVVNGGKEVTITLPYELKARTAKPKPVTSADFIYLIMPDRFADGDPSLDRVTGMADNETDRSNPFRRHGGDLRGVIRHLDYLADLGVTTLWLTPVLENDQPLTDENGTQRSSYHGYGITDHDHVDKRLGGDDAYKRLVDAAHGKGLKIIHDVVYNHMGLYHWLMKDLPSKDWLHAWPSYQNTSYRDQPLVDPYGAEIDRKISREGWFVPFMPDLNQQQPQVVNYLIQQALYAIETFGVDGFRVDSYFYNDPDFLNRLNEALFREFPGFFICGENWVNSVTNQAYFVRNRIQTSWKSNLPSAIDFQLYFATNDALNQAFGWNEGVQRWYQVLAQDLLYEDAFRNVVFLDNHDQNRFFSVVGEDLRKYKMGIAFLLTTRGIPQLYYGTEILMKNFKNPSDAEVRQDFPGGFPGDPADKFTEAGRSAVENEAFRYVRTLARYRRETSALQTGKLMQFVPQDGIYVYFRYDSAKTILVAINSNREEKGLATDRFAERMQGKTSGRDVLSGSVVSDLSHLKLPPLSATILELN
jgi:glycosidase